MRRRRTGRGVVRIVLWAAAAAGTVFAAPPGAPADPATPVASRSSAGSGVPVPPAPSAVTVGLFVPLEGAAARAGEEARRGATAAVDRASREGGIGGRALRLAVASSDRPWGGGGASALTRLIYDEGAVAVIGALDGRTAHVAEQIITRARGRAVFITPWASETTLTRNRIPWFFSAVPDDRQQARALAGEVFTRRFSESAAVWIEDDFDARSAAGAFVEAAPPGAVALFAAASPGAREALAEALREGDCDALIVFAPPRAAADLVAGLRRDGHRSPVFGPLALATPEFLTRGGEAIEGAILVAPALGDCECGDRPAAKAADLGAHPSPIAAYTYDAVAAVAAALRRAGGRGGKTLEEALARTYIEGVTGQLRFDEKRGRIGLPGLAIVSRGGLVSADPAAPHGAALEGKQ